MTDLLSADGASVAPPLQLLAAVLTGADNPYRVLQWLRRCPAAINFLNWLDTQHLSLSQLQQRHLDTWAIERPTLRSRSIPFLRWSTARRLCPPDLVIERSATQLPSHFQAEEEHRNELLRCFNDTALPLEVRVAAALVRLYALPLTRIVELTDDHIRCNQGHTYLTANRHPLVLPPKLARLIDDQLQYSPGTAMRPDADTSCPLTALDARATPSVSPTP